MSTLTIKKNFMQKTVKRWKCLFKKFDATILLVPLQVQGSKIVFYGIIMSLKKEHLCCLICMVPTMILGFGTIQINLTQTDLKIGKEAYLSLFHKVEATLLRDIVVQVKALQSK